MVNEAVFLPKRSRVKMSCDRNTGPANTAWWRHPATDPSASPRVPMGTMSATDLGRSWYLPGLQVSAR